MSRWHIYLIRTRHGDLYTGIATDVARRFADHQSQGARCAKYLRGRAPLRLVFECPVGDRSLAQTLEARVKRLPRVKKELLVRRNPGIRELLAELAIAQE